MGVKKGTVMVVDDDPVTRLLTRQYLTQWGYEAVGVEDGGFVKETAKNVKPGPLDLAYFRRTLDRLL